MESILVKFFGRGYLFMKIVGKEFEFVKCDRRMDWENWRLKIFGGFWDWLAAEIGEIGNKELSGWMDGWDD